MSQQLLNLQTILASQASWDATVQANFDALKLALRTLKATIQTQGNSGTPSKVDFQLQDANGNNITNEQFFLRIRLSAAATGYPVDSTGGRILAVDQGTVQETITSQKDLIFMSTSAGLIRVSLTVPSATTFYVVTGHAPLCPMHGNANQIIQVVHA